MLEEKENTQLEERAAAWMRENPECVDAFYRACVSACRKATKVGVKSIIEYCRWNAYLVYGIKLSFNNTYTSYLVREFIKDYPQYSKKFNFRAVKR